MHSKTENLWQNFWLVYGGPIWCPEMPSAASHDRRETCGTRTGEEVIIQPKLAQETRCTTNFTTDLDGESVLVVCSSVECANRPFSYCIDQAGLGAFTAKSGRKHYNPPPLTVMWMNFDSPNFPSLCSLSAIISFQTCSNKCILYVLLFHKCINLGPMYGVFFD